MTPAPCQASPIGSSAACRRPAASRTNALTGDAGATATAAHLSRHLR